MERKAERIARSNADPDGEKRGEEEEKIAFHRINFKNLQVTV